MLHVMRVMLLHNPSAGSGDHSAEELIDELHRAGHTVMDHMSSPKELARKVRPGCELVIVAGGDGTVGGAARALIGTGVPFAVLPLGTACNIARSLGVDVAASTAAQIAAWRGGTIEGFDTALATFGDADATRFFEVLGFGAFPRVMRTASKAKARAEAAGEAPRTVEEQLELDLAMLRARVVRARTRPYRVSIDDRDRSGDYFMVEVLNVPMIGPNLALAPSAKPGDGWLDVVLVGEAGRAKVLAGIDRLRRGREPAFDLDVIPAQTIEIAGTWRRFHRDGELVKDRSHAVEIRIERHALRALRLRATATPSWTQSVDQQERR